MNNGAELRSAGEQKYNETYENVQANFVLVLLFVPSEVECRKGLLEFQLNSFELCAVYKRLNCRIN